VVTPRDGPYDDHATLAKLPTDPRRGGDRVLILFTPARILTWRHRGELAERTVMRAGHWLA
jgi:hypothetical protein